MMKLATQKLLLWFPIRSKSAVTHRFFNVVLLLAVCFSVNAQAADESQNFLLLISYDGFRYDYLDKYRDSLPTLANIAQEGSRPDYVQNVFPAETFPNHYSIVTGLYPESHGIVANNMYDSVFNASFTMMTTDSRWWNSAEPIWVTNEKQGHKSGNCFWPGYNVKIKEYTVSLRPNSSYGKPFAETKNLMPWKDRVDLVVSWFSKRNPPSFVALYFEEPDETGHAYGTDSPHLAVTLSRLDDITLYLMKRLKKLSIFDRINFIFTADHGMKSYNSQSYIHIDKYVDPKSYIFWTPGSTRFLATNSSSSTLEDLYQSFRNAENETKGLITVYKKEEVPEEFHYSHNRRIADIVGMVTPGYLMTTSKPTGYWSKFNPENNVSGGVHGYSSFAPSMHPYLIAYGPAFKQGYRPEVVYNIDLYPLMCHILGIKPAPNNGSLDRVKHILKPLVNNWIQINCSKELIILVAELGFLILLSLSMIFFFVKYSCRKEQKKGGKVYVSEKYWDQPIIVTRANEKDIA